MTAKARVLFVDDEKRVLNSMRGLFRRDFELFLTTEGATAVKIAEETDIDVIVADQRMPGMTGIEVLGKVKELSPRTVRILLTGYADPKAVEGSINIGEVFRFLSKPCPPQVLRESLALAVDAARTNENATVVATAADTRSAPEAISRRKTVSTRPVPSSMKVVLNAPTVQEFEAEPRDSGARAIATTKHVGVVIFTVDPKFAEVAIRAVSADRNTVLATSLSKVALAIEKHQAGVLVTDFTAKSTVLQKIINALKRYLPELVTVVASSGRDTTDMVNLINGGQIFRYLIKPLDPQELRGDITAAAVKHLQLLHNPGMAKRHSVLQRPDSSDSSPSINEFVGKIQNIRSRRLGGSDKSG